MSDVKTTKVRASKLLVKCERWPTMQWLPRATVERLADHQRALMATAGERVHRSDLVAALILNWEVVGPDDLCHSIGRYRAAHTVPGGRRTDGAVPVTLKVPFPLSRRLDGLVDLARGRQLIAYRHDVVGTMIAKRRSRQWIASALQLYREAPASDAAVPGLAAGFVLEAASPSPGPRPTR
jgi:hypothetical protein